jgi:hypothetical protein
MENEQVISSVVRGGGKVQEGQRPWGVQDVTIPAAHDWPIGINLVRSTAPLPSSYTLRITSHYCSEK